MWWWNNKDRRLIISKYKIEKGIEREPTKSEEVLETLKKMEVNDCIRNLTYTEKSRFVTVANKYKFNITQRQQKKIDGEQQLYSIWLIDQKKDVGPLGPKTKRLHVKEMAGGTNFTSNFAPYGTPCGTKCYVDELDIVEENKMIVDDMKEIYRIINEENLNIKYMTGNMEEKEKNK